ncbi:flavoprotein [Natronoglycomyces albus]|uniref:Flavoprotein n=1 Tax=Natronoglycomyces albus TaxID=2811108 RepID=A0A895XY22_9ACTN|nr:flavoprotein [Natronoglycomyces albus]QSB06518.1 flavoprotein [Natronoglycomyces albus]
MASNVVYLVICGAGPAEDAETFIDHARKCGWECHVLTTPAGLGFIDVEELERASGHPVATGHRQPSQPRRRKPPADAIVIAPATSNTICKLAAGISDNYALDVVNECLGLGVPTIVLPFVNQALANRQPFADAVENLTSEGVHVLLGEDGFTPHLPGHGESNRSSYPWTQALDKANELTGHQDRQQQGRHR